MAKRFVYFKSKLTFENILETKQSEYYSSIVFIEDTQEIWTHGQYYSIPESYQRRIKALETGFEELGTANAELAEELKSYVRWSDEYKNRIVLPYVDSDRPGAGAGQIIAQANPECKEGGKVWSDAWKEQETTQAYKNKYPDAPSPNAYKSNAKTVVLAQMSQYNVQEYGSQSYPINLQGSKVRPTYNDNEELALFSDVETAINGATQFFDSVEYDKEDKKIYFYNKEVKKGEIDASDFIKDGMVSNVEITDGTGDNEDEKVLKITFNTDAGTDDIEIPISSIFNPDNYYTKDEVDDVLDNLNTEDITLKSYSTADVDYEEYLSDYEPSANISLDEAVSGLGTGIRSVKKYVDDLFTWEENLD